MPERDLEVSTWSKTVPVIQKEPDRDSRVLTCLIVSVAVAQKAPDTARVTPPATEAITLPANLIPSDAMDFSVRTCLIASVAVAHKDPDKDLRVFIWRRVTVPVAQKDPERVLNAFLILSTVPVKE